MKSDLLKNGTQNAPHRALYHALGLTDEEITERDALRKEYLSAIRQNFKQTLDSIEIIDKGE